jgi:hypothetical protein
MTDGMRQLLADDLSIPPEDIEMSFVYVSVDESADPDAGTFSSDNTEVVVDFQAEFFDTSEIAGAEGFLHVQDRRFMIPAATLDAVGVVPKENDLIQYGGLVYNVFLLRLDDDENLWIIGARP